MTSSEQLAHIAERVDDIYYAIHGNGEPGLKTRVALLEAGSETRRWFFRTLIAAIVGVSVIGGAAIVKSAVRAEQSQGR